MKIAFCRDDQIRDSKGRFTDRHNHEHVNLPNMVIFIVAMFAGIGVGAVINFILSFV